MIASRSLLSLLPFFFAMLQSAEIDVLVGTYTREAKSRGIYSFRLDLETGACSEPKVAAEASNPNFLALNADGRTVYAVADLVPPAKVPTGAVLAFRFDSASGTLKQTAMQATGPAGAPCHIAVDPASRGAVVVNYGGGYVASLAFDAAGVPQKVTGPIPHSGQLGPNKKRQDKPHPHSTTFAPEGRHALVCDLGLDRVTVYPWDAATGTLDITKAAHFPTPAGAGPRHSKFSADGRFYYVLNELDATICVFAWEAVGSGKLTLLQTIETMSRDYAGPTNTSAEIRLHPNGRTLYATNRGHDSIAVLSIDPKTGLLKLLERTPSGGQHPRHFNLSPDGRWLLCAHRDTNNVVVHRIDAATGKLTPTGGSVGVPQPICVLFVP